MGQEYEVFISRVVSNVLFAVDATLVQSGFSTMNKDNLARITGDPRELVIEMLGIGADVWPESFTAASETAQVEAPLPRRFPDTRPGPF